MYQTTMKVFHMNIPDNFIPNPVNIVISSDGYGSQVNLLIRVHVNVSSPIELSL